MTQAPHPILSKEARVEAALFRHLLDTALIPLIGSSVGSLLVFFALMNTSLAREAFYWLLIVNGIGVIRYFLTRRARAAVEAHGYEPAAARKYALTTALSGCAWGLGGFFFYKESPEAMVVTITATQSMTMGGALTLAAFTPSFLAFSLPAMLPIIAGLAIGSNANPALAAYSAIFLILTTVISRRMNRSLRQTWLLTFEKEDLVKSLTAAHDMQLTLAKTDSLTGIANRRYFDEVLEKEISRMQRSGGQLSLFMLDVDHFKAFNDTYGHIAGDDCLRQVAHVLRQALTRVSDLAVRYGGEEFAGILPETDREGAVALAEAILRDVEGLMIAHRNSPVAGFVTVSIGVVTLSGEEIGSAEEIVSLADQQLYYAKSEGRNRVASTNRALFEGGIWLHGRQT
jgi:diguanylate cyclase (GGDEF)-like protein